MKPPFLVGSRNSSWAPYDAQSWLLYDDRAGRYVNTVPVHARCATATPTPAPTPLRIHHTNAPTPSPTPRGSVEVQVQVAADHPWSSSTARFRNSEGQLLDSMAAALGVRVRLITLNAVRSTTKSSECAFAVEAGSCMLAQVVVRLPAQFCSQATSHACSEWRRSHLTATAYLARVFDAREFPALLAQQLGETGLFVTSRGLR